MKDDDGYTMTVTLRQGKLRHASRGLTYRSDHLGSSCDVNYDADAVLPFDLAIESTTKGFDYQPTVNLQIAEPRGSRYNASTWWSPDISAEVGYSDGGECTGYDSESALDAPYYYTLAHCHSAQPMSDGDEVDCGGFIIVPKFFKPDQPTGDDKPLKAIVLSPWDDAIGNPLSVTSDGTSYGSDRAVRAGEGWYDVGLLPTESPKAAYAALQQQSEK
jgi:hypothetical protein